MSQNYFYPPSTSTLAAGSATSANQVLEIVDLDAIKISVASLDTKLTNPLPVSGTFFQSTQPVSAVSLPLPAGASTSALQSTGNTSVASIDTKIPALGQALAAASVPIVLTAAQLSTLTPLSSVTVSGSVTANAGTNLNTSLLALDSTVAKDASLTTLNTSVNTLLKPASTLAAVTTVSAVTAITNALPVGANVIGKVSIDQTTPGTTNLVALAANQSVNVAQINGVAPLMGNGVTGTGSQRVTIASDNTAFSVNATASGKLTANVSAYNDYSSVNVLTSAYVQLIASSTSATTEIEIFDSSGQGMILAVGAAASEVDQIYIFPGGNGRIPLKINASSRISIKAKTATASVGFIMINFYA